MKPAQITHAKAGEWVSVEVSSASPFDSSLLLLQHLGGLVGLYDYEGKHLGATALTHNQSPRWMRNTPARIRYIRGNELRMLRDLGQGNKGEGFSVLIHKFTEYEAFVHEGESDVSADDDHFALAGIKPDGSTEVICYSLKDGKLFAFVQGAPIDGLKITAGNDVLVSGASGIRGCGKRGEWTVTTANGHGAVAVYEGRSKLIWCNAAERRFVPVGETDDPDFVNAVVMVDVDTGEQVALKSFPERTPPNAQGESTWAYAMHISTCDQPWCLVSVYAPDASLHNALWRVPFDGSESTELYRWKSPYHRDFQPRASLSRDGSRCVFNVVENIENGAVTPNVWMLKFNEGIPATKPTEPQPGTRVDAAQFVGKKRWVLEPRPDGAFDMIEHEVKP